MSKKTVCIALFLLFLTNAQALFSDEKIGVVKSEKYTAKTEDPANRFMDRCPVCNNAIFRHHRWVAIIYYEKNMRLKHLAFDGVKEMMRFYFEPGRWGDYDNFFAHIKKIVVRDYESRKPMVAKRAWYVVGSKIKGPHGSELIPFKDKKTAEEFLKKYHGEKIVRFGEITKEFVK